MANDMIAMASTWKERLHTQNVTRMTYRFVVHNSANSIKEKSLYMKAIITYKRPTIAGPKLTT